MKIVILLSIFLFGCSYVSGERIKSKECMKIVDDVCVHNNVHLNYGNLKKITKLAKEKLSDYQNRIYLEVENEKNGEFKAYTNINKETEFSIIIRKNWKNRWSQKPLNFGPY